MYEQESFRMTEASNHSTSFPRSAGILLHPTSLPGPYGIGEIGPAARRWIDVLADAGASVWQVLPLGPTGYGDSPYQSFSTFAGNPLLISFDDLAERGLLARGALDELPSFPEESVPYGEVIPARARLLSRAGREFHERADAATRAERDRFFEAQAHWLDDFALFMTLKDLHGGAPWPDWPADLALARTRAIGRIRRKHADAIETVKTLQFLFHDQWRRLVEQARTRGVRIIGDIPIYVAHDSADVWARRDLYDLDGAGRPRVVAGVPPDYFSATGQRWGNPIYRWDLHKRNEFAWWLSRFRRAFETVDIVRIDHFRGLQAYWEIPADEPTAVHGTWVPGPADRFLEAVLAEFGALPIIAEDLGLITEDVEALRDNYELPGMYILQFAFSDPDAPELLPHHYPENKVVYTGTHDNNTAKGWLWEQPGEGSVRTAEQIEQERKRVLEYTGTDGGQIEWDLIDMANRTACHTAVFPLQDVLGLGPSARMNTPGRPHGNWQWRATERQLESDAFARLRENIEYHGRLPGAPETTF
jgi:4-alpha-glucanotransferase